MATYTQELSDVRWSVSQGGDKRASVSYDVSGHGPAGATLTSVVLHVTPSTSSSCSMSINGQTVTKNVDNEIALITGETGSFSLYYRNTNSSAGTYSVTWKNMSVTATYSSTVTDPTAPSNVDLGANAADSSVRLSWQAGGAGVSNPVTGYEIQSCDSTNGTSWGAWSALTSTAANVTSAVVSVAPNVGSYRKYRVRTVATDADYKYSAWAESGMVKTTEPEAPFEQQPVTTMPPFRAVHIWRRVE